MNRDVAYRYYFKTQKNYSFSIREQNPISMGIDIWINLPGEQQEDYIKKFIEFWNKQISIYHSEESASLLGQDWEPITEDKIGVPFGSDMMAGQIYGEKMHFYDVLRNEDYSTHSKEDVLYLLATFNSSLVNLVEEAESFEEKIEKIRYMQGILIPLRFAAKHELQVEYSE